MAGFQIGDKLRITITFRDVDRVISDPTTVRFLVKKPSGIESTYTFGVDSEVVREKVGVYHFDLPFDAADEWTYRWEALGDAAGAFEKTLQVVDTHFDSVG